MEKKKTKTGGFALPLILIVVLGVGSFFIQIVFNKGSGSKENCIYASTLFPAEIIRVDTMSKGYCEMKIEIKTDKGADTLFYSQLFGGYASFEQMRKYDLHLGKNLNYEIKDLTSGECDPHTEKLLLEDQGKSK